MGGVKNAAAARESILEAVLFVCGITVMLFSGHLALRLAGAFFLATGLFGQRRRENQRIQALTDYLEQANTGKAAILSALGEDAFSRLEDEIYKTVTFLYRTREAAVQAKEELAKNLSNIAHQVKTPITAISLTIQTMGSEETKEGNYKKERILQIDRQLMRLTHLEEALLILARLDAGTLVLKKKGDRCLYAAYAGFRYITLAIYIEGHFCRHS